MQVNGNFMMDGVCLEIRSHLLKSDLIRFHCVLKSLGYWMLSQKLAISFNCKSQGQITFIKDENFQSYTYLFITNSLQETQLSNIKYLD